jgi:anti-sigma28 factor (negative regulator of flagellin synthesis)
MKTDKIARLISALNRPPQPAQAPQTDKTQTGSQAALAQSDAVRIASGFGKGLEEADEATKQEKVKSLKAQVQAGTYRPRSEDVAAALIRDLGI